jgi:Ca2+-binding RTX toxin-like protein
MSISPRRHDGVRFEPLEALEPRRLLAYALGDYFPTAPAGPIDFTGTSDGKHANATYTVAPDTFGGESAIRADIVAKTSSDTSTSRNFYTLAPDGLHVNSLQSVGSGTNAKVTPVTAPTILKSVFTDSQTDVLTFGPVPTQIIIDDTNLGHVVGNGTASGTSRVLPAERVDLPDGRFVMALGLAVEFNFDGTVPIKIKDVVLHFIAHFSSTTWLGYSIGMVKTSETDTGHYTAPGVDQTETTVVDLTRSSVAGLAADTDSFSGGTLTQNGTSGNDVLSITVQGNQIVTTRGGVSKGYDKASVQHINVIALEGNDLVTVGPGVGGVYVDAGAGNDNITGGEAPDTLTGGAGKDFIDGGYGDDRLNGNGGHDHLIGNVGFDRLYGGNENDTLEGGGGVDRIWGGLGDDLIAGGGSNDKLFGEGGNDSIYGGAGNDTGVTDASDLFDSVELLLS